MSTQSNDRVLSRSLIALFLAAVIIAAGTVLPRYLPTILNDENLRLWIEAASAAVTAFGTIVLCYLTVILARETKRLAEVSDQPQIVVTFEPNRQSLIHLDMNVENAGTATAYDIQIRFNPPLRLIGEDANRRIPFSNISLLKPKQTLSSFLTGFHDLETRNFTVHTSWLRKPGSSSRESLTYAYDLDQQLGSIHTLGTDPALETARATTRIGNAIERISRGHDRIAADVFTTADRAAAQQEREQRRAEMLAQRGARNDGHPDNPEASAPDSTP